MSKRRLSNFEERLERLIEGGFARLFRGPLHPHEVALQLARAIEDNTLTTSEGVDVAPSYYQIRFNPDDQATLLAQTPDLVAQLVKQVVTYCLEAELQLTSTPEVILLADAEIQPRNLRIEARHLSKKRDTTQLMERVDFGQPPAARMPADAQLIVDGQRTVPLTREIFNVGRHPDNDLVLSDPRISRHHLQLRLRHGRYVLYDTESRGGTYVNGMRVSEHILLPGDVIHIGGVSLLYMEEEPQPRDMGDTQLDVLPPDLPKGPQT